MSRWQAPEVATPQVVARTLATFYALGGVASLAAATGAREGAGRAAVVVFGLVALGGSVVLSRWAVRWPRWAFHVPVSGATAVIAGVVAISPDPTTAVLLAALVSFVAVDAHFFFSRPAALAHAVGGVLAVSAGMLVQGSVHPGTALALDLVVVALAIVTAQLVRRASGASRDPLTGLRNRRGFDDALEEMLATARRTGAPLSAALLDLDHFKQVNDTAGHQAGDRVLCDVARRWQDALPRSAVLARHGGDEFALLLPGVSGTDALDLVRRTAALDTTTGLSIGVAQHDPAESTADLMRRADRALYDAKRAGRGRAEIDGGPSAELAADLATALAAGDLQVVYQGIVEVATGACAGVEALARWTHPVRGTVGPDVFVPVAEAHGLVGALGEHVLRTAVADLARVRDTTGVQLVLGVNVSGRELTDPGYPQRVRDVLTELDWPAEWLVLEVTESVLDADTTAAADGLQAMRRAGLHAAVDDFGTGYSSLSRLDTLPVDHLKVDAGFTATLTTSPRRVQVLRSLWSMAQALGLVLVVEGVETAEQHAVLLETGCPYAQGWFYDRPMTADQLARRVARPTAQVG